MEIVVLWQTTADLLGLFRVFCEEGFTDVPFKIGKLGHAVLVVRDIDASVQFYSQVLGFKVSDVYPVDHAPPGQDTTLADPNLRQK